MWYGIAFIGFLFGAGALVNRGLGGGVTANVVATLAAPVMLIFVIITGAAIGLSEPHLFTTCGVLAALIFAYLFLTRRPKPADRLPICFMWPTGPGSYEEIRLYDWYDDGVYIRGYTERAWEGRRSTPRERIYQKSRIHEWIIGPTTST